MTQSGFALKINNKKWEDYASLKKTWTIEDDNAAHPVATIDLTYLEAW